MAKEKYLALADLQYLWTNVIKPTLVKKTDIASTQTCEDIVDELN